MNQATVLTQDLTVRVALLMLRNVSDKKNHHFKLISLSRLRERLEARFQYAKSSLDVTRIGTYKMSWEGSSPESAVVEPLADAAFTAMAKFVENDLNISMHFADVHFREWLKCGYWHAQSVAGLFESAKMLEDF